jgi:signal transduction histidine kinase
VTSVHQHLQAFAGHHEPRALQSSQELARLLDLARQSVQEVRRAIAGLRPTALDDFGLTSAIQMIVASMRADNWEIAYLDTLDGERLPPGIETVLFRVAQEALLNVSKHSQAKRVYLTLERQRRAVQLTVQDWGRGFDPSTLSPAGVGEQVGLQVMRERVAVLGGHWSLQSSPGQGTLIIAEIPLLIDSQREGTHET